MKIKIEPKKLGKQKKISVNYHPYLYTADKTDVRTFDKHRYGDYYWDDRWTRKFTITNEELVEIFEKNRSATTSESTCIFPPAVRWMSHNRQLVIFERPPFMHRVEYTSAYRRDATRPDAVRYDYELPIPWQVYAVEFSQFFAFNRIFVYLNNKPLNALTDRLVALPLPNIYRTGAVCLPGSSQFSAENPGNLQEGIQDAYNAVWNSGFNLDLVEALRYAGNSAVLTNGQRVTDLLGNDNMVSVFLKAWSELEMVDVLDPKKKLLFRSGATVPNATVSTVINYLKGQQDQDRPNTLLLRSIANQLFATAVSV